MTIYKANSINETDWTAQLSKQQRSNLCYFNMHLKGIS